MILTCTGLYILRNHLIDFLNSKQINADESLNDHLNENDNSVTSSNAIIIRRPKAIRDFSSQYGSNRSDSYVVSNICSKPEIYPLYGDSTHALAFRTYGKWWMDMPSYKETMKNFSRWENHFFSRDFLDIEFEDFLNQCSSVNIYETYNPGTLEVVYVGEEDPHRNITWHRVWTFPESFSIILENHEEIFIHDGENSHLNEKFSSLIVLSLQVDKQLTIFFLTVILQINHRK